MDDFAGYGGRCKSAAALPETLQEAAVVAVRRHCIRGQKIELHNLDPPGSQHGLKGLPGAPLSHDDGWCCRHIP